VGVPGGNTPPPVLIMGDSISAAYGMSLEEGWVALLRERLGERGLAYDVVNASISGETTAGGLRRIPALLERHSPAVVVIELGGNDGLRGYPPAQFESNLRRMVTAAQRAGARALLLPMELPPNYGARYTAALRNAYRAVAEETGAALGTFPLEGIATDRTLMQADGIHPTAEAQSMILDEVWPHLAPLLTDGESAADS